MAGRPTPRCSATRKRPAANSWLETYHLVKYGLLVYQDLELILDGNTTILQQQRGISFTQLDHRPVARVEADAVLRLCCLQLVVAAQN